MNKNNPTKHFLIIKNNGKQHIVNLESTTYSVGRATDNLIVLDSLQVSRYHATLLRITSPNSHRDRFRIIDGDLNLKRSRNGIKVNGNNCYSHDLEHDDIVAFADNITAIYQITNTVESVEASSCFFDSEDRDSDDFEATAVVYSNSKTKGDFSSSTVSISHQQKEASIQQSLERLASFPELFSDPIIEIDLKGNITYLNPAALKSFPTLRKDRLQHPILDGILTLLDIVDKKHFTREVKIKHNIFEQSIHLISASQLVRCYVSDITKRKRAENLLRKAHHDLEKRVEKRTSELLHNNELLKLEIAEREQKEQEILLLQTIVQAITEASNFDEAIAITLRQVCQTINWCFGEAWIPDEKEKVLKLSPAWYNNTEQLRYFREASLKIVYPKNIGQPGRVWATKKSEWIEDISLKDREVYPRYKIAQATSLKMALAVPMMKNNEVIAILIFYDDSVRTQNKQILGLVKSVAAQLGLIMERKKAEDALRSSMATNKAILDAIPDLILRIDRHGTLVNYKAAKSEDLLTAQNIFLGKHLSEVFPESISSLALEAIDLAFYTEEVQILEWQIESSPGKKNYYEVRIAVSEIDEVMAIVRDITQRKQAEKNIHQALEQQQKLNELKSCFVTMTSHEFRTPLASILSSSELLEHYGHKWTEEKKLSHLYRIQESVKHMTELLNDVLLLGKVDAGKLEIKPTEIDIAEFCQKLVEEFNLTTPTHQILLTVRNCLESSDLILSDIKILKHIIFNLLSNAVKYSPNCDRVEFELVCQAKQVIIKVCDFGIGIPELDRQQLFESFHRGDNVGSIPGTGLGLPIVKRSVDLLGGKISVESKVNCGSTFTVTIPHIE